MYSGKLTTVSIVLVAEFPCQQMIHTHQGVSTGRLTDDCAFPRIWRHLLSSFKCLNHIGRGVCSLANTVRCGGMFADTAVDLSLLLVVRRSHPSTVAIAVDGSGGCANTVLALCVSCDLLPPSNSHKFSQRLDSCLVDRSSSLCTLSHAPS